jgi:wobble nucleotide-excising tRNase
VRALLIILVIGGLTQPVNQIAGRFLNIQTHNKTEFNAILTQLVDPPPELIIERSDAGRDYLKIRLPNSYSHSSEGLGEGLISLIFLADALFDAPPGSLLVVDEPELSLHPAILRRMSRLLAEFAKERQIILATHSPYFADLSYIAAGARLARVHGGFGNNGTKSPVKPLVQPFALAFDHHLPFKLSDPAQHRQHQLAGGRLVRA